MKQLLYNLCLSAALLICSTAGVWAQDTDNDSRDTIISGREQSGDSVQVLNTGRDSVPATHDSIAQALAEAAAEADSIRLLDRMRLNPKKAGLYSSLVPGGGQIYNKEYWKLPIVYGAIGTGIGFIIYNTRNHNSARLEYSKRLSLKTDLNERYSAYNMFQLEQEINYHKENLDLSVLLTSLGYILQIMDAVAFNHLKGFDISPDISMRIKMSELPHHQIGFGIAFRVK